MHITESVARNKKLVPGPSAKETKARFESKRYFTRLTSKSCPLSNDQVKAYSALVYKVRDQEPATIVYVAKRTGLDRGRGGKQPRGVARLLDELVGKGLARKVDGGYEALPPSAAHEDWFALKPEKDKKGNVRQWWQRLCVYRLYLLSPGTKSKKQKADMTQTASDLYFLLFSLAGWKSRLYGQSKAGLASLLGVTRETVHAGLALLKQHGLVRPDGKGFTIGMPDEETLALWRDRKAKDKPRSPGPTRKPAPPDRSALDQKIAAGIRSWLSSKYSPDDVDIITHCFLKHRPALVHAGYEERDFKKIVPKLSLFKDDVVLINYLQGGKFAQQIIKAETEHEANTWRPGSSSADLLSFKMMMAADGK